MSPDDLFSKVNVFYSDYNNVIKPLIAEIESRYEEFPLPVFNEIRAFNDHIAQCYRKDITDDEINAELYKAERHISRIIKDCYKYLNVSFNDRLKRFERQTRNVDLTFLDNGEFYPKYQKIRKEAEKFVRSAKKIESDNNGKALELFELAYNKYSELENIILTHTTEVNWARVKFSTKKLIKILLWLATAIISGLISLYIGCDTFKEWILNL